MILTKAGKSVKVIAGGITEHSFTNRKDQFKINTTGIVVKDYNEHIAVDRLAAMTHLGILSDVLFRCQVCR